MKLITIYLLSILLFVTVLATLSGLGVINYPSQTFQLAMEVVIFGFIGGIVHCLRSIYIHASVRKDWDSDWHIWYYIRPILSGVMGIVSLVFIKAGLIIFAENPPLSDTSRMAYIALAFISGYNVHNFLKKIDDISKSTIGLPKSDSNTRTIKDE